MSLSGAQAAQNEAVFLEITDGDTAFLIEPQAQSAWWVVGMCKKPIPIEKEQSKSAQYMQSELLSDRVNIGVHQVELRQQFRFILPDDPTRDTKVEVYNSLRGGWSDVPVSRNQNCARETACRRRMEAPKC